MKHTRKRGLSLILSCALILTLLPTVALAAEDAETAELETAAEEVTPLTDTAAPTITGLSINGINAVEDRGNLYVELPVGTNLSGKSFALTTSESVTFEEAASGAIGELYVSSVSGNTVTLTLAVGASADNDYSITMASANGVDWSGSFSSTFGMDAGTLAEAAAAAGLTLKAGSMVNDAEVGSAAVQVLGNEDLNSAYLVFCAPGQAVSTVTYVVGDTSHVWKLPNGAVLPEPDFMPEGQEPTGWYYDEDHNQPVTFGASTTVTGNVTLYAETAPAPTDGSFMDAFNAEANVLPIRDNTDWAAFIEHAADINAGQRVELKASIDCGNATYSALTFKGDFNGNNRTISNASFSAVDGNSGMFAVIGPGQKVCNLILDNVSAKTASTYAGVLAGQIAGTEGNRAQVQNVQVKNSSATGRSAAGIAGFVFFADVKYCSSRNTTITGAANGGGIAGISYGRITDCYSTCSPTALLSSGRGGIAGKNLEGGRIEACWCTYANVAGSNNSATEVNNEPDIDGEHSADDFDTDIFDPTYWNLQDGTNTVFKSAVTYQF